MYHSHHNATDQVGRGLLGAFIVEPKDPAQRYDKLYGATQDIIWISNDALGGFTINGRGFPATSPIVATLGETIVIRFMNEGNMMHPWHLHGMPMRVVARDGYPLGSAAFTCDTLGVNPASAGTSSSAARSPARGRSTATSSSTPRAGRHVRDGHRPRRPGGDRRVVRGAGCAAALAAGRRPSLARSSS
jgi:FtsP/CotA-like multicopper oxidase with cupredoxin domain